jgi:flagellar motor protein MotB
MAEILAGENLFLMVVGYTDNDPIRNPTLRSRDIRDNLHLSLLRAKTVVDELRSAGYPPLLMYPTGWGDMRPIVPNTDKASKKLNRRVDILIDPAASNIFGMSTITGMEPAVGNLPVAMTR